MKAVVVAFTLALLLLLPKVTAWAAPLPSLMNQTVPPPTPTEPVAEVPTATPVPDDDDDEQPTAVPTALPTEGAPPATPTSDNPAVVPTATTAPPLEGVTATVNVARLNLREGPGTGYPAIGVITNGEIVRVLGRTEISDWWRVCCLNGTTTAGWVASQYLTPNFDLNQATVLLPVLTDLATPPAPTAVPTVDPAALPAPMPAAGLQLQIRQDPLYTWQGQEVVIVYLLVNNSEAAVTMVELRNELPPQFSFVAVEAAGDGEVTTENLETGPAIFAIQWPELAAGARAEVQVRIRIAADLPDGTVIDNLAVVTAQDLAAVTSGISIGMPPTTLPEFR